MPTTLLRRFVDRFVDADASDESDDDDRFVPSRLDVSVRDAHGGSGGVAEREITEIQKEAAKRDPRNR